MISNVATQVGKFLPQSIKTRLRPVYTILNDFEKYTTYLVTKRKADRILGTPYGFEMSIDMSDLVQRRIITNELRGEEYIIKTLEEKFRHIEDGDFVDIGANVGFYSLLFLNYNEGTVYAFEPLSYNVQKYHLNMRLNEFHNYNLFDIGLSSQRYETEIYYHPFNKGAGGETDERSVDLFRSSEKVSFDTLDNKSLPTENICLIKIDVEGHEQEVISGGKNTIRQQMPEILVEVHPKLLRNNGQSLKSLLRTVFEMGYESVYLLESEITLKKSEALESIKRVRKNHAILFKS